MKYLLTLLFTFASICSFGKNLTVTISNTSNLERNFETVELSFQDIKTKLPEATIENVVIYFNDTEVPCQVSNGKVLFQVSITPKSKVKYIIKTTGRKEYPLQTYARLIPERKDDWAWENNRIAFRMYGPALEATGELSNGIDVWVKRTEKLVINEWYKKDDYHNDHGEGLDYYKVGRTLGAGAMAPTDGKKLFLAKNFIKAELIETGPIRTTFRLYYAPFEANGVMVTEERIISIDANSQFNRITENYKGDFSSTMEVAAGIITSKNNSGRTHTDFLEMKNGLSMAAIYANPEDPKHGTIYNTVIFPKRQNISSTEIESHLVLKTMVISGEPFTYYNGAGWSKGGFDSFDTWCNSVHEMLLKINDPLVVKIK